MKSSNTRCVDPFLSFEDRRTAGRTISDGLGYFNIQNCHMPVLTKKDFKLQRSSSFWSIYTVFHMASIFFVLFSIPLLPKASKSQSINVQRR